VTVQQFLDGRVTLHAGDCREMIRDIPDASIDSVVCDPPYALVSISKRFANSPRNERTENIGNPYGRTGAGFMGKKWDNGEAAFAETFWAEVLRVLKPGGHVLAFSGTRTYHRLAVAIEDAGFEIRDQIGWAYGSGFPKSHDVSKGIDKRAGADREVVGTVRAGIARSARKGGEIVGARAFEELKQSPITVPATPAAAYWEGWGTALKPAWEPIVMARKPLGGTVAENVLEHGTGAINIGGCRVGDADTRNLKRGGGNDFPHEDDSWKPAAVMVGSANGRWPANIIHDGSEEVLAAFPDTDSGGGPAVGTARSKVNTYGDPTVSMTAPKGANSGSAARFFYSSKADADDRIGSKHPTVKPVDLMQYLVRLVTPPGGSVLDPFAGTGTTGEAAFREGMRAVLIEREPEYQADIARRMELAQNPTKRAAVAKSKNKLQGAEGTPLFDGDAA
jgi:site-specific DNA-methyltransferase (adenine-specific)